MCIGIYFYVYIYSYSFMYIYVNMYMYTCMCIYVYVYMYMNMYNYIYMHICIYICIYSVVSMYIHIYMYTYMYLYMLDNNKRNPSHNIDHLKPNKHSWLFTRCTMIDTYIHIYKCMCIYVQSGLPKIMKFGWSVRVFHATNCQ